MRQYKEFLEWYEKLENHQLDDKLF